MAQLTTPVWREWQLKFSQFFVNPIIRFSSCRFRGRNLRTEASDVKVSVMRSPEFGGFGYEGETALSEIERSQMLAKLARIQQEVAHEHAAAEVTENPELLAMLGKLVEGGPELSPGARAHLRRMIALSYNFYAYAKQATDAAVDEELHGIVIGTLQGELDELRAMAGGERLPDLWDMAYEDLLRLEGNEG